MEDDYGMDKRDDIQVLLSVLELTGSRMDTVREFARSDLGRFVQDLSDMDISEVRDFFLRDENRNLMTEKCDDGNLVIFHLVKQNAVTAHELLNNREFFNLLFERTNGANLAHQLFYANLLTVDDIAELGEKGRYRDMKNILMSTTVTDISLAGKIAASSSAEMLDRYYRAGVIGDDIFESTSGLRKVSEICRDRKAYNYILYNMDRDQKEKITYAENMTGGMYLISEVLGLRDAERRLEWEERKNNPRKSIWKMLKDGVAAVRNYFEEQRDEKIKEKVHVLNYQINKLDGKKYSDEPEYMDMKTVQDTIINLHASVSAGEISPENLKEYNKAVLHFQKHFINQSPQTVTMLLEELFDHSVVRYQNNLIEQSAKEKSGGALRDR